MSNEIAAAEVVAKAIKRLGTNDAATPLGALELVAKEIRDGMTAIAGALDGVAEGLFEVARVLEEKK